MNPYFKDYSEYLSEIFPGLKVQKLSVNSGGTCPNRDGRLGTQGCIYCNNRSFTPKYCFESNDIIEQIRQGKQFFSRKYKDMKYLAYFQSYTSTYDRNIEILESMYRGVLAEEDVVGIIISTRPDCFDKKIANLLQQISDKHEVFIEFGVETMHDNTLRLINRGHLSDQSTRSICLAADSGLHTGIHLIAGLPGENEEMILTTIDMINDLPIESIKLHHLQVLRDTPLETLVKNKKIQISSFSLDEYIDLCVKIIKRLSRRVAIERFLASSPPDLVVLPKWGLKNYEFSNLLINRLKK